MSLDLEGLLRAVWCTHALKCVDIERAHDLLKDSIYSEKDRVPRLSQPDPSQEASVGCGWKELDPGSCLQLQCQIPSQR